LIIFLTLTRLVVVINFVNFSFALFTPPLGDFQTVHAEVRAAAEGAPDSEQYLSGAAPDCPVPHEDKAPTVKTVRTLMVG
jgi:hypothetical protein